MKKLYTFFVWLWAASAIAQTPVVTSGTVTLTDWHPQFAAVSESPMPFLNSLTLRYTFEPKEEVCRVTTSIQWYVGNQVRFNGSAFATPDIRQTDIALFSLIDLKLRARARSDNEKLGYFVFEVNDLPPSGGTWSKAHSREIPWAKLFEGADALEARRIIEDEVNLQAVFIQSVTFGGGTSFQQQAYNHFMAKAQQAQEEGDNRQAIRWFSQAIELNPSEPAPRRQREALQRELGAFTNLESQANQLYREGKFLAALSYYQQAEQLIPGKIQHPERIEEITRRLARFKQLDLQARQLLQMGTQINDFLAAREKFAAAEEFLPERSAYIAEQIGDINRFLTEVYTESLQAGERFRQEGNYIAAAQQFYEASRIFPDRKEPRNLTRALERDVQQSIEESYNQEIQNAEEGQKIALDNAAKVVYQSSENCYLSQAEYHACMATYYQQQQQKAEREMRAMLYGERYQTDLMPCRSVTCPLETDANPDPTTLLAAAKRKHQLFREYGTQAFATFRNRFLDEALQKQDCYAEALYFKSQLANSPLEEITLLDETLACDPNHPEAKRQRANIHSDFAQEFYQKVAQGDITYLEKAHAQNVLAQVGNYQGFSPLEYAVKENQLLAVDFFFEHLAALPARAEKDPSRLAYLATEHNAEDVLRFLIHQKKADVNNTPAGKNPMPFVALTQQNISILQLLLESKASALQSNIQGRTLLEEAMLQNNENAFRLLLGYVAPENLSPQLLQTAISADKGNFGRMLIERGINFRDPLPNGLLPITFALRQGAENMVRLLIDKGIALNTTDAQGNTLLMQALQQQQEAIALYLIRKGSSLSATNTLGESALQLALAYQQHEAAVLLLLQGAATEPIQAALPTSTEEFRKAALLALGDAGLRLNRIEWMQQALAIDAEAGYYQLPTEVTLLQTAAQNGNEAIFIALGKAAPNGVTPLKGWNPLHLAARYRMYEALQTLAKTVGVNKQDFALETPLHHAVRANDAEAVRTLMRLGANPKLKNERGWHAKKLANKLKVKHLNKYM